MSDADIIERLDTLISITRLAHADRIEQVRRETRADPINAAILDSADEWIAAGALRSGVAESVGQSERTVVRRISELVSSGLLTQQGAGPTTKYRASGLI